MAAPHLAVTTDWGLIFLFLSLNIIAYRRGFIWLGIVVSPVISRAFLKCDMHKILASTGKMLPETLTLIPLPPLWTFQRFGSMALDSCTGRLYMFGGVDALRNPSVGVSIFCPDTRHWALSKHSIVTPRRDAVAVYVPHWCGFLIAGGNETKFSLSLRSMEFYSTVDGTLSCICCLELPFISRRQNLHLTDQGLLVWVPNSIPFTSVYVIDLLMCPNVSDLAKTSWRVLPSLPTIGPSIDTFLFSL